MFGKKIVRYPASITYLCHVYLIIALKNILHIEYQISDIGIFLLSNRYWHRPQQSHIGWALLKVVKQKNIWPNALMKSVLKLIEFAPVLLIINLVLV